MSNLTEIKAKLSEEMILKFLNSTEDCTINLTMLLELGVYTRKDTAVKALKRGESEGYFVNGIDFSTFERRATTTGISAVSVDDYLLTSDCFKEMCMLAETPIGKLVRKYYIEVEKRWKKEVLKKIQFRLPAPVGLPAFDSIDKITVEQIQQLPSVPLAQRSQLPNKPGVYFVFGGNSIIYIGMAGKTEQKTLRQRWETHEKIPLLEILEKVGTAINLYWYVIEGNANLRLGIERVLIDKFAPALNGASGRLITGTKEKIFPITQIAGAKVIDQALKFQLIEELGRLNEAELLRTLAEMVMEASDLIKKGFTKEQIIKQYWFNLEISPLGTLANNIWNAIVEPTDESDFVTPSNKLPSQQTCAIFIFEPGVNETELARFRHLYHTENIRAVAKLLSRIWGVNPGGGKDYKAARKKLQKMFEIEGVASQHEEPKPWMVED